MSEIRIAIIADIHSNKYALENVLKEISNSDGVICAGDLIGYCAHPNTVIKQIEGINLLKCVLGNHDYACLKNDYCFFNPLAVKALKWTVDKLTSESVKFLNSLETNSTISVNGFKIYVTHGSPFDNLFEYVYPSAKRRWGAFFEKTDADIVILGHTHIPMLIKEGKNKLIINPGSVGQPRDNDPRASYCNLIISNNKITVKFNRVEYNINKSADAIRKNGLPYFLAERLFKGI
ncbi:MAG: metallophosphoesterase family protein [Candidatus Odinarchaeia archaeon]